MNTKQAEQLRDIIAFLEHVGASGISINYFSDKNDCLTVQFTVELWKLSEKGKVEVHE